MCPKLTTLCELEYYTRNKKGKNRKLCKNWANYAKLCGFYKTSGTALCYYVLWVSVLDTFFHALFIHVVHWWCLAMCSVLILVWQYWADVSPLLLFMTEIRWLYEVVVVSCKFFDSKLALLNTMFAALWTVHFRCYPTVWMDAFICSLLWDLKWLLQ